ncbi:polysaccharide deacetylase family protein [Micromonospora sp. NBRC 107095]|uniref:polysaccharide deacetylase family protein n=1 Tax=Micromonospora sp. NBRC 107095 TaxID=3032209 RepID=UPI002557195F|nr:polysaccharide deacetylase family protein [Micromonospora sp. NBRC 107095]
MIRAGLRPSIGVLVAAAVLGGAGCEASRVPPADQPVFVGSSASSSPSTPSAAPSVGASSEATSAGADPAVTPSGVPSPPAGPSVPGATPIGTRAPVVDHGPRTGNKIALTFDADMTDAMLANLRAGRVKSYANLRILDLLEREQVPATFFLTGKWVRRYPDVTRRIAGNPRFEVANHTYGHAAFTGNCYDLPSLPVDELAGDVAKTFEVIEPYGGRQTRYFRFPGLCHDAAALDALAPLGVTVVDGDVVSGDPFATAWKPLVRAVLDHVRPGSVVIMHVTEANAAMTDEALPHILVGLRKRGLVAAPLSEVLAGG